MTPESGTAGSGTITESFVPGGRRFKGAAGVTVTFDWEAPRSPVERSTQERPERSEPSEGVSSRFRSTNGVRPRSSVST